MNTEVTNNIKDFYAAALCEISARDTGIEATRTGIKRSVHLYKMPQAIRKDFKAYIKDQYKLHRKDETDIAMKLVYEKAYILGIFTDFGYVIDSELAKKIKGFETMQKLLEFKRGKIKY